MNGLETLPHADAFVGTTPAGPLGAFPGTDTWMHEPYVPGVVLAGDAAGWSDPTIGQGLSVAMRDVRVLSEILSSDPPWDFGPYAEERGERMRRLRIALQVTADLRCDFPEHGRARRAALTAAFDASGEWQESGARSLSSWLAHACNLPITETRRQISNGRALRHMPLVAEAWLGGDISAAHVGVLAGACSEARREVFARDEKVLLDDAKYMRF